MTEQEFRAAVLEVFPSHSGEVYPVTISREWHTQIRLFGEKLYVEWISHAKRGERWQVRANGVTCSSGTLADAVEQMRKAQIRIADTAANIANMIRYAKM